MCIAVIFIARYIKLCADIGIFVTTIIGQTRGAKLRLRNGNLRLARHAVIIREDLKSERCSSLADFAYSQYLVMLQHFKYEVSMHRTSPVLSLHWLVMHRAGK